MLNGSGVTLCRYVGTPFSQIYDTVTELGKKHKHDTLPVLKPYVYSRVKVISFNIVETFAILITHQKRARVRFLL